MAIIKFQMMFIYLYNGLNGLQSINSEIAHISIKNTPKHNTR